MLPVQKPIKIGKVGGKESLLYFGSRQLAGRGERNECGGPRGEQGRISALMRLT